MCPECENNLFAAARTYSFVEEEHPHSDGSTTYSLRTVSDDLVWVYICCKCGKILKKITKGNKEILVPVVQ